MRPPRGGRDFLSCPPPTPRTIYRTAYRRSPGPAPARPRYACCPGWKRTSGLPGACGAGEGCGRPGAQSTGVPSDTGPVRQQSIPCSDAGRAPAALLSKPEWSLSWLHGTPSQLPPLQGPGDPPELVTGLPHPQQYASLHARTEGSVSSQAAATALQDGRATPARQVRRGPPPRGGGSFGHLPAWPSNGWAWRGLAVCTAPCLTPLFLQTWMNAVLDGAAVPSAVSTPQGVIGASVGRGTAPLRMGQSACPREGLPGSPTRTPQQVDSCFPHLLLLRWGGWAGRAGHHPTAQCSVWQGHQREPAPGCRPALSPGHKRVLSQKTGRG